MTKVAIKDLVAEAPDCTETLGQDGSDPSQPWRNRQMTSFQLRSLLSQPRSPDHDSVVVAGNGVGALTFAARLARSPEYAGKVVIAAPPMTEARRLISGVSLRGRAADFICDAIGIGQGELMNALCDSKAGRPAVFRRSSSLAQRDIAGIWQFDRPREWGARQGRRRHQPKQGDAERRPLGYGLRNSDIVAAMWELVADLGITRIEELPRSAAEMRAMAPGARPLLVNATADPRLLGAAPKQSGRMVLATQVPFVVKPVGTLYPLEPGTAYAPLVRREGGIDTGYFMPFADPLSPQASWYGLVSRVMRADTAFDPYRELEVMTEAMFGIGEALGLTPDDPSSTLGCALVPTAPDWGSVRSAPGTLELRRAYFGGAPGFYLDGMLSAAAGGLFAARAVLTGADPDLVVRRALRTLHWHILARRMEATRVPLLSDRLSRLNAAIATAFPLRAVRRGWIAEAKIDRIVTP